MFTYAGSLTFGGVKSIAFAGAYVGEALEGAWISEMGVWRKEHYDEIGFIDVASGVLDIESVKLLTTTGTGLSVVCDRIEVNLTERLKFVEHCKEEEH